jgi:hypothetical protein
MTDEWGTFKMVILRKPLSGLRKLPLLLPVPAACAIPARELGYCVASGQPERYHRSG